MRYSVAKPLAEKYANLIRPGCIRLEIVGNIKRGDSPDVHDMEFLILPDERRPKPEFGKKEPPKNRLYQVLDELTDQGLLHFVKGKDKMRQYRIPTHITFAWELQGENEEVELNPFHLELWIVRPETWGIQNVIRTGPADFSTKFVTNIRAGGWLPDDCEYLRGETQIKRAGQVLSLPEEKDALALIGAGWIEPQNRRKFYESHCAVRV